MNNVMMKLLPLAILAVSLSALVFAEKEQAIDTHSAESLQAWGYQASDMCAASVCVMRLTCKLLNAVSLGLDILT